MSKLRASDRTDYRALLSKYARLESEFRLNEDLLHLSPDGTLEGSLWVIHVRTGLGVTFQLNKFRMNWLESFEDFLRQDVFPRE